MGAASFTSSTTHADGTPIPMAPLPVERPSIRLTLSLSRAALEARIAYARQAAFGDPKFGIPKRLTVKYLYMGFTRATDYLPEDRPDSPSRLVLPELELRKILEKMFSELPDN